MFAQRFSGSPRCKHRKLLEGNVERKVVSTSKRTSLERDQRFFAAPIFFWSSHFSSRTLWRILSGKTKNTGTPAETETTFFVSLIFPLFSQLTTKQSCFPFTFSAITKLTKKLYHGHLCNDKKAFLTFYQCIAISKFSVSISTSAVRILWDSQ